MDMLLPDANLLLRKKNISFALSSERLKRVKMDLSLSLGILMKAGKEYKKRSQEGHFRHYKTTSSVTQLINLGLFCKEFQCQEICSVNSVQNLATPFLRKQANS